MTQQARNENRSARYSTLRTLLAVAAAMAAPTAIASTKKYVIAGTYPTKSQAARAAARLDLDQAEIERLLALDLDNKDANWLERAQEVFENGMHAGVYAKLTLTKPLEHVVLLPDPVESEYNQDDKKSHDVYELNVLGFSEDSENAPIQGIVRTNDPQKTLKPGRTTELNVFYGDGSNCMTRGSTDGCFAGPEGGVVLQGYGGLDYAYDPTKDNKFSSSLKWYSEDEGLRMYYCENHGGCKEYQEYEHFYDFYGILDYGNHWIESAFQHKSTNFPLDKRTSHGYADVDFSVFSDRSRNAAISTATVSMNVFTAINRLMTEFGLDGCKKNSKDYSSYGNPMSMDSVIASWDQAAAIYAGSALITPEGEEPVFQADGYTYYHMVDELAKEFGVIEFDGIDQDPSSTINLEIMEFFLVGKHGLTQEDCDGQVLHSYRSILHKLRVPWIQGVLKTAFEFSDSEFDGTSRDHHYREDQRGTGAAHLAALLPDLYHCNKQAAATVLEELSFVWKGNGKLRPDYKVIRDALEHQYQCLGVTCDEIGGFLNPQTGGYYEETRPCGGYGTMISQRRESVTVSSTQESFADTHKSGMVFSGFIVALGFFFITLSVLVVAVQDRARGRNVNLTRTAQSLVSGVLSQADYWLTRNHQTHPSTNDYNRVDYEVQLRPIGENQYQDSLL